MLIPPDWDMRYIECFGFTLEDIGEEGANSLETKMRSAGMPIDELPGPPVFPVPGTAARARRARPQDGARRLPRREGRPAVAGPGGHGDAASRRSPAAWTPAPRRSRACSSGSSATPSPWHVVVANGDTRAERGLSPTRRGSRFKSSFEDFVDVAAGRQDPRKLMLRGRMRYRGDLRWLWKSRRMFPA